MTDVFKFSFSEILLTLLDRSKIPNLGNRRGWNPRDEWVWQVQPPTQ